MTATTMGNLYSKQAASDKKAFPVILESLKRELQEQATEKDSTMHALIRIILAMHLEKSKFIDANCLTDSQVLAIHKISIGDVCKFMASYRKNNPEISLRSLNNIRLIRLSMVKLIELQIQRCICN